MGKGSEHFPKEDIQTLNKHSVDKKPGSQKVPSAGDVILNSSLGCSGWSSPRPPTSSVKGVKPALSLVLMRLG